MGFNIRDIAQYLEQPHAVNGTAGARNSNDKSFHDGCPFCLESQTLPDYSIGRKSGGPLTAARKTKSPQSADGGL
ncbi:hypothetical protein RTE01_10010 [Raoultella terrigena]|nr:hypothetical protein RTE01_10010 [Raoultella terrigena]